MAPYFVKPIFALVDKSCKYACRQKRRNQDRKRVLRGWPEFLRNFDQLWFPTVCEWMSGLQWEEALSHLTLQALPWMQTRTNWPEALQSTAGFLEGFYQGIVLLVCVKRARFSSGGRRVHQWLYPFFPSLEYAYEGQALSNHTQHKNQLTNV